MHFSYYVTIDTNFPASMHKKCEKARIIIKRMQLDILRPPSNKKEFWQIELINNLQNSAQMLSSKQLVNTVNNVAD